MPKGKSKLLILNALFDIYYSWKQQLDKLKQPYYLKIWFYDQRFSRSQVVCAVGEKIDHYENVFFNPQDDKKLKAANYLQVKSKLDQLEWQHRLDEDILHSDDIGEPEDFVSYTDYLENKKYFLRAIKKPHRTIIYNDELELYAFKVGDIWIGG